MENNRTYTAVPGKTPQPFQILSLLALTDYEVARTTTSQIYDLIVVINYFDSHDI